MILSTWSKLIRQKHKKYIYFIIKTEKLKKSKPVFDFRNMHKYMSNYLGKQVY